MPWNHVHHTLRKKTVHKIMWGLISFCITTGHQKHIDISMVGGEMSGEFLQWAFIIFVIRITKGIKNEWLTIRNLPVMWYPGKGPRRQERESKDQGTGILKW